MEAEKIVLNFNKLLLEIKNSSQLSKQKIFTFFSSFKAHKKLTNLLDAMLLSDTLREYASQPFLDAFWDNILVEELLLIDKVKGIVLKFQPGIKSFHLIVGLRYYLEAIEYEINSPNFISNIEKALSYDSMHAVIVYTGLLMDEYEKKSKEEIFDQIIAIASRGLKHGMPGYYHFGKTCYFLSQIDPNLITHGLIAFYIAEMLQEEDKNAFHNAYIAMPLEQTNPYCFTTMNEIISAYITNKAIGKEKLKFAYKEAEKKVNLIRNIANKDVSSYHL